MERSMYSRKFNMQDCIQSSGKGSVNKEPPARSEEIKMCRQYLFFHIVRIAYAYLVRFVERSIALTVTSFYIYCANECIVSAGGLVVPHPLLPLHNF